MGTVAAYIAATLHYTCRQPALDVFYPLTISLDCRVAQIDAGIEDCHFDTGYILCNPNRIIINFPVNIHKFIGKFAS